MPLFEHQYSTRRRTSHLLLAFAITLCLLVLAVNAALWLAFWLLPHAADGSYYLPRYFFAINTGVTLLFVLGGWWMESSGLNKGGEVLARRMGARELRPQRNPPEQQLAHIVHEIATAAHVRTSTIMVWPRQDQINAFAVGLTVEDAAIVVTDGALDALSRAELQGLVAHELSHIVEGDTRLNTRLIGMVFGLEMVFRFGQALASVDVHTRNGPNLHPGKIVGMLIGWPVMAVGALGWLAGRLLCAAVLRQREYLADARAVQWTRNPHGLAGVLRKIMVQQEQEHHWQQQRRQHGQTTDDDSSTFVLMHQQQGLWSHLMFSAPPLHAVRWSDHLAHWLEQALATHPAPNQRLQRLYGLDLPTEDGHGHA